MSVMDTISRILDLINKGKSLRDNDVYSLAWEAEAIRHNVVQKKDEDQCEGIMEPEYIYNQGCVINAHWVCNKCWKSITDNDLYWILSDQDEITGGLDIVEAYEHTQDVADRDYQDKF